MLRPTGERFCFRYSILQTKNGLSRCRIGSSMRIAPNYLNLLLGRALSALSIGRPRTCVPGTISYALGFSYTAAEMNWKFWLGAILSFMVSFSANIHNALSDLAEDSYN